jgi:CDGSH-type Zn-finger protein
MESWPPLKFSFAMVANCRYNGCMSEPIVAQKSPFAQKAEADTYWWCACSRSKSQPFCDGSHKGTGFTPKKADITEARTVAWCGCKHSKNAPFCDGSHAGL